MNVEYKRKKNKYNEENAKIEDSGGNGFHVTVNPLRSPSFGGGGLRSGAGRWRSFQRHCGGGARRSRSFRSHFRGGARRWRSLRNTKDQRRINEGDKVGVRAGKFWGIPEKRMIPGNPDLLQSCLPSELPGSVSDPWQLSLVVHSQSL